MHRQMATVKQILDVVPIPGADNIELARVDGWQSVIKKGQFQKGDKVVFCEPDSLLPEKPEFEFMRPKKFRIKTCKLRGVVSQGICFPMDILPEDLPVGTDVSEILGITKYEPPIPVQLRGLIRCQISRQDAPKTDEMRVQNIPGVLMRNRGKMFDVTEKIDGTSASYYLDMESGLHVCSRSVDLTRDEANVYWKYALENGIEEVLEALGENIAIQGELFGEGIQGNKYKIKGYEYRIFDFWDRQNQRYVEYETMVDMLKEVGLREDFLVPYVGRIELNHGVEDLLKMADGRSLINGEVLREGLVFRSIPESIDAELGRLSFKAVSNEFLLKHGE